MDNARELKEGLELYVLRKVGPGGDFLTERHTPRHLRELWQPAPFDRRRAEDWAAIGKTRLGDRLREKTMSLIEAHRPEPLPASVREEIARILKT